MAAVKPDITPEATGVSSLSIARCLVRLITATSAGTLPLVDLPHLRNSVAPHIRAGSEACHPGGECNLDFDAAFIVNFLELLKATAKDVIDVGSSVLQSYLREVSARKQAVELVTKSRGSTARRW